MLTLEIPNESHREMYEELCEEIDNYSDEFIHPDNIYSFRWTKYWELLENMRWDRAWTRNWRVPATAYFGVKDGKIIWAIQLRHNINHPNLEYRWWHIWYWIRPSEREKWYASKMLSLVLDEARKIQLEKVLVTCDINNIWSNKVIQNNGWVLEKECIHEDGTRFNRYWITL